MLPLSREEAKLPLREGAPAHLQDRVIWGLLLFTLSFNHRPCCLLRRPVKPGDDAEHDEAPSLRTYDAQGYRE